MLFGEIKVKVDYLRTVDKITCVRPARYLAFFICIFLDFGKIPMTRFFICPVLNKTGQIKNHDIGILVKFELCIWPETSFQSLSVNVFECLIFH